MIERHLGADHPKGVSTTEVDLRSVFDAIDEGFCVCEMIVDSDGAAVDYRFLVTNPLFEQMTGLADAAGRTALELVPDLESHWIETYARAALGGERIRFQQGSEAMGRWFDVFATPLESPRQFAIVFKDTTTRHLAEVSLRETSERFRQLLDELPLLVWVHDRNGEQEFVNRTFCEYFGVTREQMRGDRWQMLVEPESGAAYSAEFARAVAEQRSFHGEVWVRNGDGAWRLLESWATPRFDPGGSFIGHVGTSADITATRAALRSEREARQRSQAMERTAAGLASAATVDEVAASVVEGLAMTDVSAISVGVEYDGELRVVAASTSHSGVDAEGDACPVDADLPMAIAFRSGEVVESATGADHDRRHPGHAALRREKPFESLLAVPIVDAAGASLAVLEVTSPEPHWFTPDRRSLLEVAALQAGGAFERAIQQARERAARERAAFVGRAVAQLEGCDTVDAQIDRLTDLLVPEIVDFVSIETPADRDHVRVSKHHEPDRQHALAALRQHFALDAEASNSLAAVADGTPQLIPVMTDAIRSEHLVDDEARQLFDQLGVRSHLAVPIAVGHADFTGTLLAGITDPERPRLGPDDVDFFLDLARHVSSVINSTASRRREQAASIRLQRALLPQGPVDNPHVDVAAHYRAGDDGLEVGGDWYDTFTWPSGHFAIVVGDVVGHDIAATVAMGRLRVATETLIQQLPPDPARIIGCIEECAQRTGEPAFLTAACVVFDPSRDELHYLSAGHPPGLVIRGGRAIWLSDSTGGPICALPTGLRVPATLDLQPDDLIVLYSDGLIERRHQSLRHGMDALQQVLGSTPHYELEHLSRAILDAIDTDFEDDTVLVVTRYAPTVPTHRDRLEPHASELRAARDRLRQWLEAQPFALPSNAIVLAVNEAVTNAVDHSGCRNIDIRATADPAANAVEISVSDDGAWRLPSARPSNRGRGLQIMRRTAARVHLFTDPTGTSTLLSFRQDSEPTAHIHLGDDPDPPPDT